ncbi:MAG: hypothetical protein ABSG78_08480 [Verrucomicrobiota bacterium]
MGGDDVANEIGGGGRRSFIWIGRGHGAALNIMEEYIGCGSVMASPLERMDVRGQGRQGSKMWFDRV